MISNNKSTHKALLELVAAQKHQVGHIQQHHITHKKLLLISIAISIPYPIFLYCLQRAMY